MIRNMPRKFDQDAKDRVVRLIKVGNLENKINSMSPKHEFYDKATAFGKDWVDQFASEVR